MFHRRVHLYAKCFNFWFVLCETDVLRTVFGCLCSLPSGKDLDEGGKGCIGHQKQTQGITRHHIHSKMFEYICHVLNSRLSGNLILYGVILHCLNEW